MSELPQTVLDHFIHVGEGDRFSVIATMTDRRLRDHRRRSPLRVRCRYRQFRIRPVDRRPLAGPGHRLGVAAESGMPRRRVRRRAPVRRYLALQRGHDRACPQVRLRLRRQSRATGSWCASKSRSTRAAGNSLRQLAARGGRHSRAERRLRAPEPAVAFISP